MKQKMIMRLTKEPNTGFVNEGRFVEWGIFDGEQFVLRRRPEPVKKTCDLYQGPFWAAGKEYRSLRQLWAYEISNGEYRTVKYIDCYKRTVIDACERFPCFDSYDYASENRYYHNCFIMDNNQLSYIYFSDNRRNKVTVIDDLDMIPGNVWRRLVSWELVENKDVVCLESL